LNQALHQDEYKLQQAQWIKRRLSSDCSSGHIQTLHQFYRRLKPIDSEIWGTERETRIGNQNPSERCSDSLKSELGRQSEGKVILREELERRQVQCLQHTSFSHYPSDILSTEDSEGSTNASPSWLYLDKLSKFLSLISLFPQLILCSRSERLRQCVGALSLKGLDECKSLHFSLCPSAGEASMWLDESIVLLPGSPSLPEDFTIDLLYFQDQLVSIKCFSSNYVVLVQFCSKECMIRSHPASWLTLCMSEPRLLSLNLILLRKRMVLLDRVISRRHSLLFKELKIC
jgi:hypothetical protein